MDKALLDAKGNTLIPCATCGEVTALIATGTCDPCWEKAHPVPAKPTTVTIVLEIEGDPADARHVVDSLLDAGFLQDAINDHDADAGPVHVKSAVVQ